MYIPKRYDVKRTTTNAMINSMIKGSEAIIDVFGKNRTYILLSKKRDKFSGKMIYTFLNPSLGKEIEYTNGLLNFTMISVSNKNILENREIIKDYKYNKARNRIIGNVVAVKTDEDGELIESRFFVEELPSDSLAYLFSLLNCCECHHSVDYSIEHFQDTHDGWEWYYVEDYRRKFE